MKSLSNVFLMIFVWDFSAITVAQSKKRFLIHSSMNEFVETKGRSFKAHLVYKFQKINIHFCSSHCNSRMCVRMLKDNLFLAQQ